MPIYLHNEDRNHFINNTDKSIDWLESVIQSEEFILDDLNYIFCSDDYLLDINKTYLNHDYYTDVITFDNSDTEKTITGDIFISIDRIKDFSSTKKISPSEELNRVMVHGLLHLLGYKDKSKEEKSLMTQKEDSYLSLLKK